MSSKVKVVNSVWNGPGVIKRKVAEYYVAEGRAEWVGERQIRLIESHPKNLAAAERAGAWCPEEAGFLSRKTGREVSRALRAASHRAIKWRPPRRGLRDSPLPATAKPPRAPLMRQQVITDDGKTQQVWCSFGSEGT